MTIPKKIIKENKPKKKNTSNRIGKAFEDKMSNVFDKYIEDGLAYIVKIPTEFILNRGAGGKIVSAFPRAKSRSLDYVGVLKSGEFISFECKTYDAAGSKNPKPFSLNNIKEYQYQLCDALYEFTDKVFYIIEVRLEDKNEVYVVYARDIKKFKESSDRKSIPYETLKDIGIFIENLDILKYLS